MKKIPRSLVQIAHDVRDPEHAPEGYSCGGLDMNVEGDKWIAEGGGKTLFEITEEGALLLAKILRDHSSELLIVFRKS